MKGYDVIVAGLGTAGSAACLELAKRGVSVLGLDALRPPHDRGGHHGESRSIRRAYLEGTAYVPMAMRSWELWERLSRDTGIPLLTPTGNLTLGPPGSPAVTGFLTSARAYGIPHEALSAAEIRRRWPALAPPEGLVGGLEKEAGVLLPEAAISVFLERAFLAGAELRFHEPVTRWSARGGRILVRTPRAGYEAGRMLLASGAGNLRLLGETDLSLFPKRVPVHWVRPPEGGAFSLGAMPVNFWQLEAPDSGEGAAYREFYALPAARGGGRVKTAPHNGLETCDPADMDRTVSGEEVAEIRAFLERHLPALGRRGIHSHVCLYTGTPDGNFTLGRLPGRDNVVMTALAGHGFKFAPVLGEILADLLTDLPPAFDLAPFSPGRFHRPDGGGEEFRRG